VQSAALRRELIMAIDAPETRRDGRCFWLRQAIAPGERDAPALRGDHRADMCIVGGGFVGLWTAIELKRRAPTLDVMIVEADICGGGASGRSSGMVLPQWVKFAALEELCGTEGALAFCRASAATVGSIAAFCALEGIDAEFRPDPWLWAATSESQRGAWRSIVENFDRHGAAPFREMSGPEIQAEMDMPGLLEGVRMDGTATLQPAKLVRGLRRVALARGVRIHENTAMTRLERTAPPRAHVSGGCVTAGCVILTMNAWSMRFPELRSAVLVISSDDAITAPVPEKLAQARYIAKPLISDSQTFVTGLRTTMDNRLNPGISGGEIGYGGLGARRFEGRSTREAAIRACVRRASPGLADIPFVDSWSGPIDRTRSGLPLFGRMAGAPNVLYGYGFSGNGIATAPLAARILASLALGEVDEWSRCGLVRPPEYWLPPEPIRYLGAHAVRRAIRRKDSLGHLGRKPGPVARWLAGMAPGGIVTTRLRKDHQRGERP